MTTNALARFCTSCGESIEPCNSFCTSCGAAVDTLRVASGDIGKGAGPLLHHSDQMASGDHDAGAIDIARDDGEVNGGEPAASDAATSVDVDEADRRADVASASFQFLVVREVDPGFEPETDGLIYPLPASDASNSVVLERRDGSDVKRIVASGFKVVDLTGGNARSLSSASDLRLDVMITDSRVALACSKFTKGGGWTPFGVGALPVTLVLNGVSKARAASRRRGKMLVGHVRYPWLAAVGGASKSGFGTSEQLRLCVGTQGRRLLALDLTLPKNIDSTAVAAEILRRAAQFRIEADDPKVTEHATEFDELTRATPLPNTKGQFGLRAIPEHWPVDAKSARLGLDKS